MAVRWTNQEVQFGAGSLNVVVGDVRTLRIAYRAVIRDPFSPAFPQTLHDEAVLFVRMTYRRLRRLLQDF